MDTQEQRYNLASFQAFVAQPEHTTRLYELIDGELVEKVPSSFDPSNIAGLILTFINLYLFQHKIGRTTTTDGAYVMSDDNVFAPDVAFISQERMPERPTRQAMVPPDLAVEVKSPTDSKAALRRKAAQYLTFGTRLVWVVFPEDKTVEVYQADAAVVTLGVADQLDGGDVLPGFTVAVKQIFEDQV